MGLAQQTVSALVARGTLEDGAPLGQWLLSYCGRLREQAAGRLGPEGGDLDLPQERAALAREQRASQALKNLKLRTEFTDAALLRELLATISKEVSTGLDRLPEQVRKACPQLPPAALEQVVASVRDARKVWISGTAQLRTDGPVTTDDDLVDTDDEGH